MTLKRNPEARVGARAEQKRRWDDENLYDRCSCGRRKAARNELCNECRFATRKAEHEARLERIADLYDAGASLKSIAAEFRTSNVFMEIDELRKRGRIGYRREPQPPPLERYQIQDRGHLTPCWIWQGKPDGANGYGRVRVGNGRRTPAHRFFYEHHRGAIPEGLQPDHLCCVSLCVNPDHMELVTGTENNRRRRWNKLTAEQAAEIRAFTDEYFRTHPLNSHGEPRKRFPQGVVPDLAKRYGCSPEAVAHVIKGRTWR